MKEQIKTKPPIIEKELLSQIEKTFRRIWDKEQKTDVLFKKAVSLHGHIQALLSQEFCMPEHEQNAEAIATLCDRLRAAEETIDAIASLTGELHTIREYFYESLSAPKEIGEQQSPP